MISRTVLEWKKIKVVDDDDYRKDPETIPRSVANRIVDVAKKIGTSAIRYDGSKALRARDMVGVIAADGCQLEILPKIDFPVDPKKRTNDELVRKRLMEMLAVALDIDIKGGQVATLGQQQETLLEIIIRLFSKKLTDVVRKGLPKRYVAYEEDLAALRGRLDMTRQFTVLAANPSRLACRYDELSPDIALNHIMKAAITRLIRITQPADNQRRLHELAFAYVDVADIPVSALRWHDVVLDRTNARWREVFELAKLLLKKQYQTTSTGELSGFSLLFNMNNLFEKYIARLTKRALAGNNKLNVISQGGYIYCLGPKLEFEPEPELEFEPESDLESDLEFEPESDLEFEPESDLESKGLGLFQTRPDILIKQGRDVVQIIDTKWKVISETKNRKWGVNQSDIYQMMAYGQVYDCPRVTLLYPHHSKLEKKGFSKGRQMSRCVTNSEDRRLEIATIDIAESDNDTEKQLRKLFWPEISSP